MKPKETPAKAQIFADNKPEETERAKEIEAVKAADAKKAAGAEEGEHHGKKLDVILSHLDSLSMRMDEFDVRMGAGDEREEGDKDSESMDDPDKPMPPGGIAGFVASLVHEFSFPMASIIPAQARAARRRCLA